MKLDFLGGAGEVGRSAVLVDDALLLDYGAKPTEPPGWPLDCDPEAVVVSHGHLDHAGGVPALLSGTDRPPVHWTPPTHEFAALLARDTLKLHGNTPRCPFAEPDVHRLGEASVEHGYGEPFEAAGYEVTLYDAGHIPGSAHVLVDDGDTRLLYTGDFHTDDQRLVPASTARPEADVVICESTYSDVSHDPRARVEERFAEAVRETVVRGGTVVVPAFAIGRTQEVLMVCDAHGLDPYVDGMGVEVLDTLVRHPDYVRDHDALRGARKNARTVTGRDGQRKRIAAENTVVVTTSGMLNGGPAMTYVPEVAGSPANLVAFSGYQVAGTPGRELLETGSADIDGRRLRVAARRDSFDFSAHADREGLFSFLSSYGDATVLVNHGDRCGAFADELRADGYDASAPDLGATVEV
ncbi:MBL fold metallo-hydrolase [Halosegnis marinus]|uniref:MBL fold metallo-hydrolase n=1 Tax=Halosegnis marinus TaxID=3034023 RepID=A0ABD5ZPE9_9EURY|nr:MBL fold metallo-hydrolase [Halosegnis sp. DT85]